jgi:hypothetical protein
MGCDYLDYEVDAKGQRIEFETMGLYGLPTFTRISDHCQIIIDEDGHCPQIASDVNAQLGDQAIEHFNHLKPCDSTDLVKPVIDICEPLDLPDVKPQISITWGDSDCDCIESDDVEVMYLTICNPYSNIVFDHFTIHQLTVVDDQGNPVATLPNGQPSIQLIPVGPYCFGEIEPCSCISREFVLRNRGAITGSNHIKIDGVCFDAHLHFDQTACFSFDICKD